MAQCTECHSTYSEGALFCANCGALTKASNPIPYTGSVLLATALLGLIFCGSWLQPPLSSNAAVTAPAPPPDEAAVLIEKCGKPDVDSVSNSYPVHRTLVYRREKVKAVFGRLENSPWARQDMLDTRTQKAISAEMLKRRLPCADPERKIEQFKLSSLWHC